MQVGAHVKNWDETLHNGFVHFRKIRYVNWADIGIGTAITLIVSYRLYCKRRSPPDEERTVELPPVEFVRIDGFR